MLPDNPSVTAGSISPMVTLRRLARGRPDTEHCEFCSLALGSWHRHLLEIPARKLVCVCDACALRFHNVVGGRWKLIPRQPRPLADFRLSDAEWESLSLPINLAFFCRSTLAGKITALYPSPAGATESMLSLASWEALVAQNPVLDQMQDDVEALLVNRVGSARDYYLAPIDTCYELAGLIRVHWRGLSGGEAVWREIREFFERLRSQAPKPVEVSHA